MPSDRGRNIVATPESKSDDTYEKCYFDLMSRRRWKTFKNLGEVLDRQLVFVGKVTRSTQTNWKWRLMAERWRHAKLLEPSVRALSFLGIDEASPMRKTELMELRKTRSNDKAVDTEDLQFDPYMIQNPGARKATLVDPRMLPASLKEKLKQYARLWKYYVMMKKNSGKLDPHWQSKRKSVDARASRTRKVHSSNISSEKL